MGDHDATTSLCQSEQTVTPIAKSGILSTVLSFIQQCENDTFDNVVLSAACAARAAGVGALRYSGMLKSPVFWIAILRKAVIQDDLCISLDIARSIGPLVRCMCNDMERMFFKSNKYWREGIAVFVHLISSIVTKSLDPAVNAAEKDRKETVDTLLNHESLLSSIIQWGFYDDEHRPDIVKEVVRTEICTQTVSIGMNTVAQLVRGAYKSTGHGESITSEGISRLKIIGKIPVVSKKYDPNCTISYVEGLIHLAKREGAELFVPSIGAYILESLIENAGCVDKDVIKEMIDWGTNYDHDVDSAELVTKLSSSMICVSVSTGLIQPNDTRTAFAIRAGLIEMCLSFVEQFGRDETFEGDNNGAPVRLIHRVISMMNDVSFQKKTWKAIRHKKSTIEEKLGQLARNTDFTTSNNAQLKQILNMVRSILDLNGSYCCRCNKSLTKTEVIGCNDCGCMVYCSSTCQREDWLNGHSVACCKSYTHENIGTFQGRYQPDVPEDERAAAKLKEMEKNQTMVQLKLFLDHSDTILSQASSMDIPIYDCVVLFDLRHCPPTIEVKKYTDGFHAFEEKRKGKVFESSRSEENITCLFCSYIYCSHLDNLGYVPTLQLQRLFPCEWLLKQSKEEGIDNAYASHSLFGKITSSFMALKSKIDG